MKKRGPTCAKLYTLLRTDSRQIIPLFRTERTKPIPYSLSRGTSPFFSKTHSLPRSAVMLQLTECPPALAVSKVYHPQNCHVNIIHICLILESKSVIWEIKRDKFRKSKVSFEISNATNFGNRKCHLRNQTQQTLEIKRVKFWKSNMHLRNQTQQTLEIKIVIREIKGDKFKIKMTQ